MKTLSVNAPLQRLALLALTVATKYAIGGDANLDHISERYGVKTACPKELAQREGACEAWRDTNYISIKKVDSNSASVEIARSKVVQKRDKEPEPYYCFIAGYAKLQGRELVLYEDNEGNQVRGLRILVTPQSLKVIDQAQREHRPEYCGDYVTFHQFTIER